MYTFSSEKKYNFMHFEIHYAFQNALNYYLFVSENLKKILGFDSDLGKAGLP